jgi:hypothetical protein
MMDHSKTAFPHFFYKNKAVDPFMKLLVALTRSVAHGFRNIRYAHYGLDIYLSNSNHTDYSLAKLLKNL